MTTANKILWGVAATLLIAAALTFPKTGQLHQKQAELISVNKQISRYKHSKEAKVPVNISSNETLEKERVAQDKLSKSLNLALGGIHSADDWNNSQSQLKAVLGSKLTAKLKSANQNPNTKAWDLAKNDQTVVSFGNVNENMVPVIADVSVENKDHIKGNYLIKMNYDLNKQKVSTYVVHVLTARGSDHILRGGQQDE